MMVRRMERRFGIRNVLHVDNLFGSGHVLQPSTERLSFVVLAAAEVEFSAARTEAEDIVRAAMLKPHLVDVPVEGNAQDVHRLSKAMLSAASDMV